MRPEAYGEGQPAQLCASIQINSGPMIYTSSRDSTDFAIPYPRMSCFFIKFRPLYDGSELQWQGAGKRGPKNKIEGLTTCSSAHLALTSLNQVELSFHYLIDGGYPVQVLCESELCPYESP
jgi:hypothetical protein